MKLDQLVESEYNPRKIGGEEFERLKSSIKTNTEARRTSGEDDSGLYRLCSPVIINRQGNRIIGGHQRCKALEAMGQEEIHDDDIHWVNLEPNSAKEKALNLSLNNENAMGSWTEDVNKLIDEISTEMPDLSIDLDLDLLRQETKYGDDKDESGGAEADLEQALQLEPPREYILIMCDRGDNGQQQFEKLRKIFSLELVRRGGYKIGSPYDDVSVQRVIHAKKFFDLIGDSEVKDVDSSSE
jgi:hypothetical protein